MALAGVNKGALQALGGRAVCYMADEAVARAAGARGVTRAAVSMEYAALLDGPLHFRRRERADRADPAARS